VTDAIGLCVNTQTPFVRFRLGYHELMEKYGLLGGPLNLEGFTEGVDFEYTPGGVTAMVYPLLMRMVERGILEKIHWISLGPDAPAELAAGKVRLHHVRPESEDMALYSRFKEGIWKEVHGFERLEFKSDEYEAYARYNWLSSQLMLRLLDEVDLFWIHDFQQLMTGNLIGPSAPAILRWHIPMRPEGLSDTVRTLILKNMEGFDAIVVSTRRELQGLINAGYRGKAYQIYPYIDPEKWREPSRRSVDSVRERFGLAPDDQVALVVGRMDPIKSQDMAIEALAHLEDALPRLKLILVGNGSFTGSARGGLAHPKATRWRSKLQDLVRNLHLDERVIFTGYVRNAELRAFYSLADVLLVPSRLEGFNLTTVEGWIYRKPVVVSRGAGSAELVHDEVNGYTFDVGDSRSLAEKMGAVIRNSEAAAAMGENGFRTARNCLVDTLLEPIREVFKSTLERFQGR
jgi:glycosyltransferase involved in cell wall biosynthesis